MEYLQSESATILSYRIFSPLYFQIAKMSQILQMKTGVASRGHVYRCAHCTTVQAYQGERRRVISHLYKDHVALINCPYYCRACLFRSTDQVSLLKHVKGYGPHSQKMADLAARGRPTTDASVLLKATEPYLVKEGTDFVRLDPVNSEAVWSCRNRQKATVQVPPVSPSSLPRVSAAWLADRSGKTKSPVPSLQPRRTS